MADIRKRPPVSIDEGSDEDKFDDDDMSLSMTECQDEAADLLQGIIEEQEALLHRITNEHDEFLSRSSSASSLASE